MVGFITERANPTQISVKTLPTSINGGTINAHTSVFFGEAGYGNLGGNATVFGTDYNDTGYNITIVDVATEHNLAWGSNGFSNYGSSNADNTNDMGYNLMTAINGNKGFDPQDNIDNFTDTNSPYTKLNDGAPLASYIDVATTTGCNTMVAIGKSLPGTLLA
jgi:hypothetical protein